jgi:hypothetical protein
MTATETKTYGVAEMIPLLLRKQMVSHIYVGNDRGLQPNPRCITGRCPLGWLFDDNSLYRAPHADTIAHELRENGTPAARTVTLTDLTDMVREFIFDWDAGQIKDLHLALGLSAAPDTDPRPV